MGKKLENLRSKKQRAFVLEYVANKDFNATEAYLAAGYNCTKGTARRNASELLSHTDIQEAISEVRKEREARTLVTMDRIITELARVGLSNIGDFLDWDGEHVTLKKAKDLTPELRACISEIHEIPGKYGTAIKFKLHNKISALELIGRHLGMFNDKLKIGPTEDGKEALSKILTNVFAKVDGATKGLPEPVDVDQATGDNQTESNQTKADHELPGDKS